MNVTLKGPEDVLRVVHQCLDYVEYEMKPAQWYDICDHLHKYVDMNKHTEYWNIRNHIFVAILSFVKVLTEEEDKFQHAQYLKRKQLEHQALFCRDWKHGGVSDSVLEHLCRDNARYEELDAGRDATVEQEIA